MVLGSHHHASNQYPTLRHARGTRVTLDRAQRSALTLIQPTGGCSQPRPGRSPVANNEQDWLAMHDLDGPMQLAAEPSFSYLAGSALEFTVQKRGDARYIKACGLRLLEVGCRCHRLLPVGRTDARRMGNEPVSQRDQQDRLPAHYDFHQYHQPVLATHRLMRRCGPLR